MSAREPIASPAAPADGAPPAHSAKLPPARRLFRRGPWENFATLVIAAGVVMLMQPWLLVLYTYSFVTIFAGTVLFTVVARFPD